MPPKIFLFSVIVSHNRLLSLLWYRFYNVFTVFFIALAEEMLLFTRRLLQIVVLKVLLVKSSVHGIGVVFVNRGLLCCRCFWCSTKNACFHCKKRISIAYRFADVVCSRLAALLCNLSRPRVETHRTVGDVNWGKWRSFTGRVILKTPSFIYPPPKLLFPPDKTAVS